MSKDDRIQSGILGDITPSPRSRDTHDEPTHGSREEDETTHGSDEETESMVGDRSTIAPATRDRATSRKA